MIRFLKVIVLWLEKRFPEKVAFTPDDAIKLKSCAASLAAMEERIKKAEMEINKFNVSLGFGGTLAGKIGSPFER